MSFSSIANVGLGGALGGIIGYSMDNTSPTKSNFENVESKDYVILIIMILIIILLIYMICKATYNLTGSITQTVFCFLSGSLYLYVAYLYYGLAGYKFQKII